MSYAIFRVEPINTLKDLGQIGAHNKRDKKAYLSNPDIDMSKTKNNIDIVPLSEKYTKGYYELVKEYKKEYEEKQKTTREDRRKAFNKMLDDSNSVVADELLFTSDSDFFKNMSKKDIKKWGDTCMEFVYNDLGYKKEQVLHATIHMDEKTPHLHCVVVPLVRKLDKRTNQEKWTISKKQYIKDKIHLSTLQDKYWERMKNKGFDLERGIKHSDNEHISIKEFKKITKKLDNRMEKQNYLMTRDYEELEEKLQNSKPTITKKEVKIDKETYDTLKNFMNTSQMVIRDMPKNEALYQELKHYTENYKELDRNNYHLNREITRLRNKNEELEKENKRLKNFINTILQSLKKLFKKILNIGTENEKDDVIYDVKTYHRLDYYTDSDLRDIADNTPREEEIKDYIYEQNYSYENDYYDRDIDI